MLDKEYISDPDVAYFLPCVNGLGEPDILRIWKNDTKDGEFCPRCDFMHDGPCLPKNVHSIQVAPRGWSP